MREILDSLLLPILAALGALVLGWVVATSYWLEQVRYDCEKLGKFRYNGAVYECSRSSAKW